MDVSLDTDIVIHLYKARMKELLFYYFDRLYIYEYLLEKEMKKKSMDVYNEFHKDIDDGKIIVVNNSYLVNIGMQKTFEEKLYDFKNLFDFGEANAIALAASLGIAALVTDDTKQYGPHESLVKELVEDVIPFAFYELLFLNYIESKIDLNQLKEIYELINITSFEKPMGFSGRISRVARRFSKHGTERDILWMKNFCKTKKIDYGIKMRLLRDFLQD